MALLRTANLGLVSCGRRQFKMEEWKEYRVPPNLQPKARDTRETASPKEFSK